MGGMLKELISFVKAFSWGLFVQ